MSIDRRWTSVCFFWYDRQMAQEKEDLKKEIDSLETDMTKSDFWLDKVKAQATIKRIALLKD